MNVKIQSVKFDADKRLVDFIQAKMDKMDRFVERAIGAQVTLRIDKDDEQGNKVAIVKIDVAGDELLAERRTDKGYEKKPGQVRNETLDLSVQALAVAEHKGLSRINWEAPPEWAVLGGDSNPFVVREISDAGDADADEPAATPAEETRPAAAPSPPGRGGWLQKREKWL